MMKLLIILSCVWVLTLGQRRIVPPRTSPVDSTYGTRGQPATSHGYSSQSTQPGATVSGQSQFKSPTSGQPVQITYTASTGTGSGTGSSAAAAETTPTQQQQQTYNQPATQQQTHNQPATQQLAYDQATVQQQLSHTQPATQQQTYDQAAVQQQSPTPTTQQQTYSQAGSQQQSYSPATQQATHTQSSTSPQQTYNQGTATQQQTYNQAPVEPQQQIYTTADVHQPSPVHTVAEPGQQTTLVEQPTITLNTGTQQQQTQLQTVEQQASATYDFPTGTYQTAVSPTGTAGTVSGPTTRATYPIARPSLVMAPPSGSGTISGQKSHVTYPIVRPTVVNVAPPISSSGSAGTTRVQPAHFSYPFLRPPVVMTSPGSSSSFTSGSGVTITQQPTQFSSRYPQLFNVPPPPQFYLPRPGVPTFQPLTPTVTARPPIKHTLPTFNFATPVQVRPQATTVQQVYNRPFAHGHQFISSGPIVPSVSYQNPQSYYQYYQNRLPNQVSYFSSYPFNTVQKSGGTGVSSLPCISGGVSVPCGVVRPFYTAISRPTTSQTARYVYQLPVQG